MERQMVRFGVVGVKGFSQRHIEWINRAAKTGAAVRLGAAATIFDDPESLAVGEELARSGVRVVKDYQDLLNLGGELDMITLPVGIHLHAPLAVQALDAGFPVYMEKPAAGTVDEVVELAEAEKRSGCRLFVGFQTLYQPSTWLLKEKLRAGMIGRLEKIVVTVAWPRPMSYYRRNRWAGKLEFAGRPIFDCPMNNSSAHFLNAALFLAGSEMGASAVPVGVQAELYRAAPIESADSDFSRFSTKEGVEIVFNASHSCREEKTATLDIIGDKGTVRIHDHAERILAPWTVLDGKGGSRSEGGETAPVEVFERVAAAFLDPGIREVCTLANAGMHTAANQMAFQAAKIHDIPEERLERIPFDGDDELVAVAGMNEALETLRQGGTLPGEADLPWAQAGGRLDGEAAAGLASRVLAAVR